MSDKKCYDTRTGAVLDIFGNPVPPNVEWAEERVSKLEEEKAEMASKERIESVHNLTEEYFEKFQRRMDADFLYRLATVLDYDYTSRKGRRPLDEPNPSLSEDQKKRRVFGNKVPVAYRFKEVPLSHANSTGIDGVSYALPRRRKRT